MFEHGNVSVFYDIFWWTLNGSEESGQQIQQHPKFPADCVPTLSSW